MIQSREEIFRVYGEWSRGFAPANFIQNGKNAKLLADYVLKMYGFVSITHLNEAEKALASQLDRVPEPSAREKEIEKAKKAEKKMLADYLKSIDRSQQQLEKNNEKDAQDAKKIADEKELKSIKSQIYRKISSYFVGHPIGGRDYSRTESGQATLRGVLASVVGGRASDSLDTLLVRVTTLQLAKAALAAVTEAFFKLP